MKRGQRIIAGLIVGIALLIPSVASADGGAGNDTIYGTSDSETFYAGPGNDTIYGRAGNDVIYSGGGADVIRGGPGFDICWVSARDDVRGCEG